MANKLAEVPKEVLHKAFGGVNEPQQKNTELHSPKVTLLNGKTSYKREYTVLGEEKTDLDVPELEVGGIILMTGAGGNLSSQLKNLVGNIPGGPYMVDGRDDGLTIHNRNFNQKPIASYTYRGGSGELTGFKATTTRTKKTLDATGQSSIDPDTKVLTTTNTQVNSPQTTDGDSEVTNPNTPTQEVDSEGKIIFRPFISLLGKKLPQRGQGAAGEKKRGIIHAKTQDVVAAENKNAANNYNPTAEEKSKYLEACRVKYKELSSKVANGGDAGDILNLLSVNNLPDFTIKRKVWVAKWVQPYLYSNYNTYPEGRASNKQSGHGGNYDIEWQWREGYSNLTNNKNIHVIPKSQVVKWDGTGVKPEYKLYDPVYIAEYQEIEVPVDGSRLIVNANPNTISAANEMTESIQEEITGTFTIVGNPDLESSKMMDINNVSKKYSGEWYIKKVKHTINSAGYLCNGEVIKKGSTIVTNTVTSNTSTKSIYADLSNVAQAKIDRTKTGFDVEKEVMQSIEKVKAEERSKGIMNGDDSSYHAVVEYTGNASAPAKIRVVRASQDVVNINDERYDQKAQAEAILKNKK